MEIRGADGEWRYCNCEHPIISFIKIPEAISKRFAKCSALSAKHLLMPNAVEIALFLSPNLPFCARHINIAINPPLLSKVLCAILFLFRYFYCFHYSLYSWTYTSIISILLSILLWHKFEFALSRHSGLNVLRFLNRVCSF